MAVPRCGQCSLHHWLTPHSINCKIAEQCKDRFIKTSPQLLMQQNVKALCLQKKFNTIKKTLNKHTEKSHKKIWTDTTISGNEKPETRKGAIFTWKKRKKKNAYQCQRRELYWNVCCLCHSHRRRREAYLRRQNYRCGPTFSQAHHLHVHPLFPISCLITTPLKPNAPQ